MLNAVFKTIDDRRDDYIAQLQTLCRQPSVGSHGGEQMARTAGMVEGMVRGVGAETIRPSPFRSCSVRCPAKATVSSAAITTTTYSP